MLYQQKKSHPNMQHQKNNYCLIQNGVSGMDAIRPLVLVIDHEDAKIIVRRMSPYKLSNAWRVFPH